jgi:hypothetical protein
MKNPIPAERVVKAAPVETGDVLTEQDLKSANRPVAPGIDIPFGFHVCFSIEEQPVGMVRHVSISVDTPGKCPSESAVAMIAEAFGILEPFDRIWLEEFEPGHHCVNVIKVVGARPEGHA